MLKVKSLLVYPVKSFAGHTVGSMDVGQRGPKWDRQWMVVDKENKAVTQLELPQMSQVGAQVVDEARVELRAPGMDFMDYGVDEGSEGESFKVKMADAVAEATEVEAEVSEWVSEFLKKDLKLVRMKDDSALEISEEYGGGLTTFTEGFPFMLLSTESMDLLNTKLGKALSVSRFRPNILVTGAEPHEEDSWNTIQIAGVQFRGVKLCARDKVVTIQPLTGEFTDEPLKTLADYRKTDKGVVFGKNFIHMGTGEIRTGMPVSVLD
ncbi:MAG: MOSC domain-containing protein [Bdellovibrionales bacterium]|nr:MOSC domain-containing protein [Bdellovibrionales bacterium]